MAEAPTFGEPQKRVTRSKKVSAGQTGLDSFKAAITDTLTPKRELKKNVLERWYTVQPGVEFRTGPLGSESGEFLGRTVESVKIRRIGEVSRHNGIASIYATVELQGEIRGAWFNLADVRKVGNAKSRTTS